MLKAEACCSSSSDHECCILDYSFPKWVQTQHRPKGLLHGLQHRSDVLCGVSRQLRERHTKLEDFASWLGLLRRVQAGEVHRLQQEETALALWDMFLTYGGKPLEQHQDKFDEMKEESATFTKVCSLPTPSSVTRLRSSPSPSCCCLWLNPA